MKEGGGGGEGRKRLQTNPSISSGVRHDPQRFMGKIVAVPHFNRDTVEFASRERDESNPGIKTCTASFSEKHNGRERFGEFSRSHNGLRCLLLAS